MYGSSYFDDDDNFPRYNFDDFPRHNFDDHHHHSKDSYFGPPLWFLIPFVIIFILIFCAVVYGIIKACCCKNSTATARPIFGPPVRVTHTHTMEPSHGPTTVIATAPIYEHTGYGVSHIPHSYPNVHVHQTSEKTHDSHAVSNNTSHSHSVSHDLPPSYAAAVGSASAAHCASDSGAGFTSDSGAACTSDSGAGCTADSGGGCSSTD